MIKSLFKFYWLNDHGKLLTSFLPLLMASTVILLVGAKGLPQDTEYQESVNLAGMMLGLLTVIRCCSIFDIYRQKEAMLLPASLSDKFVSRLLFGYLSWSVVVVLDLLIADYVFVQFIRTVMGESFHPSYRILDALWQLLSDWKNISFLVFAMTLATWLGCWANNSKHVAVYLVLALIGLTFLMFSPQTNGLTILGQWLDDHTFDLNVFYVLCIPVNLWLAWHFFHTKRYRSIAIKEND